jgi:hypothetical protein
MTNRSFNGVALTDESIRRTRKWYADNAMACIAEAESGHVRVNDMDEYRDRFERSAERSLAGLEDGTLSFLQLAYFIQTGESVPLLPK